MNEPKRILVVDDDAFIRRPLLHMLEQEGFLATAAVDGDDCLARMAAAVPDLVLLDVMMPGRDGFTVCRALKQDPRWADIPVILLSAKGQESDRVRGLALGAADFLTKPYSPADLLQRVRRHLARV
jgi:DNA-binding response OmpR family regulator